MDGMTSLKNITVVFISNMQALRVFHERIGPMADEHDRNVVSQLAKGISELLPGVAGVSQTDRGLTFMVKGAENNVAESDLAAQTTDNNGYEDAARPIPDEELPEEVREIQRLLKDEDTMRTLFKTMSATAKQSPTQGNLLRRAALTTLVGVFDGLVADLIRFFYHRNPEAIPSENRSLSLAQLRELGSVEDAENYLVSKEVDTILWQSLQSQFDYLAKRLKVDLTPLGQEHESLIEIFQRRNVLVHNGGLANRQYTERVSRELIDQYDVKEGEEISVSEEYLSAAIDTAYVSGLVLAQQCWRKWDKVDEESMEEADMLVVNQLYDSLLEQRFELTVHLSQYTGGLPFATDKSRRMAIVNHAIALKNLGRREHMESVLKGDWSACALEFRLALHALKNEEDEFYSLLPGAVAAEEIEKWHLRDWPLFAHLRGTERFEEAFVNCFPEASSD